MKTFSRGILAAVAIVGVAWLAVPAASAHSAGPKISTKVGHSVIRGVGPGGTFAIASCDSSAPSTVGCDIWKTSAITPRNSVRVWCLAPTSSSGIPLTVSYKSDDPSGAISPTTLTVKCKAPGVTKIPTPNYQVIDPLVGKAPFSVTGCSTDTIGTTCSHNGTSIKEVCEIDAFANTLPVTVDATVSLGGADAINGKTITFPFECR